MLDFGLNVRQLAHHKIGPTRFVYRILTGGLTFYAGLAAGGPVGILVGGTFYLIEYAYTDYQKKGETYELIHHELPAAIIPPASWFRPRGF